jgi:hypothetical protein
MVPPPGLNLPGSVQETPDPGALDRAGSEKPVPEDVIPRLSMKNPLPFAFYGKKSFPLKAGCGSIAPDGHLESHNQAIQKTIMVNQDTTLK